MLVHQRVTFWCTLLHVRFVTRMMTKMTLISTSFWFQSGWSGYPCQPSRCGSKRLETNTSQNATRLLKPLPSGYLTVGPCQIVACARWVSTKHWLFSKSMSAGSWQVWLQCHQRPFVPVRRSLMNGPRPPWFGLLEVSGVSMPKWDTMGHPK